MGGWLRHRPGDVGVTALAVTQECTQMPQNGLSVPFWGICVHCCDASRDTNLDASCVSWHERLNHHGVPAAPPSSLAPLAWLGRQTLREWRRCQADIFAEAPTHTNP